MSSFPHINPTYSTDLTLHQHLINYISTSLASGKYDRIPSFYSPPSRDVKRLVELWNAIYRDHYLEIQERLRSRRVLPNNGLEDTLRGLRVHSMSLRDDPHINVHAYELFSLLPPSLRPPKEALIPTSSYRLTTKIDEEVQSLCRWFKEEYMNWVDPILCSKCSSPTKGIGSSEPTAGEREDGANRVELHQCQNTTECGEVNRFCRFSKVKALIRDRRGRCGEWAQLFYCFLRLNGVESRYIWNSEDHVWCEYWSPTLQHWVHVDPCEAVTNKPLLYARGWGKKQAFCLAFGAYGAEDVTRAYVDDWEECKIRRRAKGWKELDLRRALFAHTVAIRLRLPTPERIRLEAMDNLQSLWIADERGRLAESERAELGGRVSGPEDWRAMRDEMGLGDKAVQKPNLKVIRTLTAQQDQLLKFGNTRILNDPTNSSSILLTDGPSQTSSIFHPNPINQNADFRCSIKFKLTSPGSGEADGIALILAKGSKSGSSSDLGLGLGGYGLGYDGLGGEGDFAIEIDTYRTQDYANDPPTPHISIHSPPKAHHKYSLGCTKPGSIPFLSDGRVYELEVIHQYQLDQGSEPRRRIRGYLHTPDGDELEVIDVELPSSKTRTNDDGKDGREQDKKNENENGNDDWWIGISGSCGGLWQRQEILDWQIDLIKFDQAKGVEEDRVMDEKEKEKEVEIEKDEV